MERGGQSSVKTWLFGIGRNVWLQHLRRSKNKVERDELLNSRDDRTQSIVNLRVEGWSFSEVAEKWGISENSARVIDFRTRKWIKETIKKEGLL